MLPLLSSMSLGADKVFAGAFLNVPSYMYGNQIQLLLLRMQFVCVAYTCVYLFCGLGGFDM